MNLIVLLIISIFPLASVANLPLDLLMELINPPNRNLNRSVTEFVVLDFVIIFFFFSLKIHLLL